MDIKDCKNCIDDNDNVEYTEGHTLESIVIDDELRNSIDTFIKRQNELEQERLRDIMPF